MPDRLLFLFQKRVKEGLLFRSLEFSLIDRGVSKSARDNITHPFEGNHQRIEKRLFAKPGQRLDFLQADGRVVKLSGNNRVNHIGPESLGRDDKLEPLPEKLDHVGQRLSL